jgi:hypothetical protein
MFHLERVIVQWLLYNISFGVSTLHVRPSESLYVFRIVISLNKTVCFPEHLGPNSLCNGGAVCLLRHKPKVYVIKQHAIGAYSGLELGIFVFLTWHLLGVRSFRLRPLYSREDNSWYVLSTMNRVRARVWACGEEKIMCLYGSRTPSL